MKNSLLKSIGSWVAALLLSFFGIVLILALPSIIEWSVSLIGGWATIAAIFGIVCIIIKFQTK